MDDYTYKTTTVAPKDFQDATAAGALMWNPYDPYPPSSTAGGPQPGSTTGGGSTTPTNPYQSIYDQAAKIQDELNKLKESEGGDSGLVSSSDNVTQYESDVTNSVRNLDTGEEDATSASDKYTKILDDEIARLESQREQERSVIEQQYAVTEEQLKEGQAKETGATSAKLARIGGYLGESASGTGALLSLAKSHRQEISLLAAKRAEAILLANQAIDEKQFQLAQQKAQEAKDLEKEIYNRRQQYFQNSITMAEEQRTKIKDDLEKLSILDPKDVPPEKLAEIDSYYGVKGFAQRYLEVASASAQAKSQQDIIKYQKDLLGLLQDIPQGQTVKFPDGTEYTGMGKVSDIALFRETDTSGNVRLYSVNKGSNAITVQSLGRVGKGSGSGGGGPGSINGVDPVTVDNVVNKTTLALEQFGKEGKYYDPDTYVQVREELKNSEYSALLQYVDNLFLNEQNGFFSRDGIQRLRDKGIFFDAAATAAPDYTDIVEEE